MQVAPTKRDQSLTFAHHLPGEALRMDAQSNHVKTEPGEETGIHNSDSALLLYQDFDEDANGDDHSSHHYPDFRGNHKLNSFWIEACFLQETILPTSSV